MTLGSGCTTGNAIHEIGHVVGLWHEQSREDRDSFVTVNLANVTPGYEHNFDQHITDGDDVGAYDYGSIMHYPRDAFSKNGQDTIVPTDASAVIGQRTALSAGDIAAANSFCPKLPTFKEQPKDPIFDTIKEQVFDTKKEQVFDTFKEGSFDTKKEQVFDTKKEQVLDTRKEQTWDTVKEGSFDPIGPFGPYTQYGQFGGAPGAPAPGALPFGVDPRTGGAADPSADAETVALLDQALEEVATALAGLEAARSVLGAEGLRDHGRPGRVRRWRVIVVISHAGDPHARHVLDLLEADGRPHFLLDLAHFPDQATLTVELDRDGVPRLVIEHETYGTVDLAECRSVWWRRPQVADLRAITDPAIAQFAYGEWSEAMSGLWQLLPAARWINDPDRDSAASHKLGQLRLAAAVGLAVPASLVTTDGDEASSFIARHGVGRTIFKTFSCTHEVWRETRVVTDADLGALSRLRVTPVIFQECVEGVDLRVTVIGRAIFAAEIDASTTSSPFDFRPVLGDARVRAVELPDAVNKSLLRMMDRFGLEYGAFDLRRTPQGEHVFLEVNTAGEFLFVEHRTGLPIARALADHLAMVPQDLRQP